MLKIKIGLFIVCLLLANFVNAGVSDAGVEYDDKIKTLFLVMDEVPVIVDVKDFSDITINYKEDSVEIQTIKDNQRWDTFRDTSDSVLLTLSENEFKLEGKSEFGRFFYGNITKEGFNKLLKDARVKKVHDNTVKGRELIGGNSRIYTQIIFVSLLILLFVLLVLLLIILVRKRKLKG